MASKRTNRGPGVYGFRKPGSGIAVPVASALPFLGIEFEKRGALIGADEGAVEEPAEPEDPEVLMIREQAYRVDKLFAYRSFVIVVLVLEMVRVGLGQAWLSGRGAWATTYLWVFQMYPPVLGALTMYLLARFWDDDHGAIAQNSWWRQNFANALMGAILLMVVEWILWVMQIIYVVWIWIDGSTGFAGDHTLVVFTIIHIMVAFAIRVIWTISLTNMSKALRGFPDSPSQEGEGAAGEEEMVDEPAAAAAPQTAV